MTGIIIKGIGGFYYVKTADQCIYECRARGKFRKDKITPMIGDKVEIETDGEKGSIVKIFDRRNSLIRPPVANIDKLVIVVAAAVPDPNLFLIDKMLINAEINGIDAVICINKTDLASGEKIEQIYEMAGYEVITLSALKNKGIDKLMPVLKDSVTAFAGLSGVGKSSLLNLITGENAETGSVSDKILRGRHTTRHVELFELKNGGFILDTPGFSSFEIEGIGANELWEYFPEMRNVSDECKYRGCSHINEPGCKVKELLETGGLYESRYESYKELYNILKEVKEWERK